MNTEELLRSTLQREADASRAPVDLLARAISTRRHLARQRRLSASVAAALVVGAGGLGWSVVDHPSTQGRWSVAAPVPSPRHVGAIPLERPVLAFLDEMIRETPARGGSRNGALSLQVTGTTATGVQFAVARFSGDPSGALRWAVGARNNYDQTWVDYQAGSRGFTELEAGGWSILVARPGTESAAIFSNTGQRVEVARAFTMVDGIGLLRPAVTSEGRPQLTLALAGARDPYYDGDYFE